MLNRVAECLELSEANKLTLYDEFKVPVPKMKAKEVSENSEKVVSSPFCEFEDDYHLTFTTSNILGRKPIGNAVDIQEPE